MILLHIVQQKPLVCSLILSWSNVSKVKSLKDRSLKLLSKCICHCLCLWLCLRRCLLVGQVIFSHHSNQMSQRWKVSKIALWRCSLNVFVIVFVFVFVFLLVMSCFLMIPINFARLGFGLEGWNALNPTQSVSESVTKVGLELLGQLKIKTPSQYF